MNPKRVLIGLSMVIISLFLVFPKADLQMLNWGSDVLNVILALIPAILITKGLFKVTSVFKFEVPTFEGGAGGERIEDVETDTEFEAKGNWRGEGHDTWQSMVKNNELVVENGYDTCHYAKKFRSISIDSISINSNLTEDMESSISIEVGTNNTKEPVDRFNPGECQESEEFIVTGQEAEVKPDISWGNYSFVKILIDQNGGEEVRLKNIKVEGKDK